MNENVPQYFWDSVIDFQIYSTEKLRMPGSSKWDFNKPFHEHTITQTRPSVVLGMFDLINSQFVKIKTTLREIIRQSSLYYPVETKKQHTVLNKRRTIQYQSIKRTRTCEVPTLCSLAVNILSRLLHMDLTDCVHYARFDKDENTTIFRLSFQGQCKMARACPNKTLRETGSIDYCNQLMQQLRSQEGNHLEQMEHILFSHINLLLNPNLKKRFYKYDSI